VRIAVSGSHGTGKSTLIAAFLERRPHYHHEPEAFETLADDVDLTPDEGPTADGLQVLLEHTISAMAAYSPGARVVFERSPVDYLAYAAAARSWPRGASARFLTSAKPLVRRSLRHLDLVVLLPVSKDLPARGDEDPRFRRRVDEALRRALVDDDYNLFRHRESPRVAELPPTRERQLAELVRLTAVPGLDAGGIA
jgi:predicted ATPase